MKFKFGLDLKKSIFLKVFLQITRLLKKILNFTSMIAKQVLIALGDDGGDGEGGGGGGEKKEKNNS